MEEKQKEIVGWKLKDEFEQCREAALKLSNTRGNWENSLAAYDIGTTQTGYIDRLKQAGVLDIWFEPVYKKEETFCVGDWVTVEKYVVGDSLGHNNFKIGETFCVKRIESSIYTDVTKWIYDELGREISINSLRKATPEEIKSAQTPQIVVNGYSAKFHDEYVEFGCAKIDYQQFIDINELFRDFSECYPNSNRGIESVTIGKGTFYKEQTKAIAEYYLNKK